MNTDAQFWARVRNLFHAAVDLPAEERSVFLSEAAHGDPELVAEVEGLLRHDHDAASVLDFRISQMSGVGLNSSLTVPDQIGPYRIVREIGRGGMSIVYLAERDDLESQVALKVLATGPLSPFGAERFLAEEKALARLSHSSIARILDAGILPGGPPFFVMEWVDGIPISKYVASHDLSVRSVLGLMLSVCDAVDHAHRQAIIHRDLKPSNILVTSNGQAKLLDFGIAKRLDDDLADATVRMMTPAYAAPEQLAGRPVGVHTDVFALGVLLYELLTGALPTDPERHSIGEFEHRINHYLPDPPSKRHRIESLSRSERADIDSLCLRALNPDVAARYPSVEAFARDIRRFLDDRPLEARTPAWRYRAAKFARRNRATLGAGLGVLALLVGVTMYYSLNLANARDAAIAEAERVQRIQQFMLGLFEHDDTGAGPSDTLRLVTILNHGVQEAHLLENDPDVQAELFQTLGLLFMQRGSLERADSLLSTSVAMRRSARSFDAPALARSLITLGRLRIEQARLDDADALIEEGMEIARNHHPTGHPDVADAMIALGTVYEVRGDYDRAADALEEVVRMLSSGRNTGIAMTSALGRLANTHFYAGRYAKSDSLNRLVLAMEERAHGRRHPNVAGTLVNLGATRFQLGQLSDAEAMYRRALEIYVGYYGSEHHLTASNMSMLAQALVRQERLDEAAELLRPALEIRERAFGANHPRVANSLSEFGTLELQRENYDAAEQHFTRMLEIYRGTYDGDHFHIGIALSNLASVYYNRGEFQRADDAMEETTRTFVSTLGEDHMQVGYARIKHGRILAAMGQNERAREELHAGIAILEPVLPEGDSWIATARRTINDIGQIAEAR